MALNATNERDYTSGLTIDLGPTATAQFSALNVEGRGFGGAQNLRTHESPFARLHTLVISSDAKRQDGSLDGRRTNGRPAPARRLADQLRRNHRRRPLLQQRLRTAARRRLRPLRYRRGAGLQPHAHARRTREACRNTSTAKYDFIKDVLPPDRECTSAQLETVKDPPPVQMFVPGFSVRELPLDLTNINNVKYRADGTLVALAYDGKIWLLRDTERRRPRRQGRPVLGQRQRPPLADRHGPHAARLRARQRRVRRRQDALHADRRYRTATTRPTRKSKSPAAGRKVFTRSTAWASPSIARDGSVYYGRGTYNFTDPLLQRQRRQAAISASPTNRARSSACRPISKRTRSSPPAFAFPVALRFNARGDLFCTDQEGATWVPNGNPFDELLHIQQGRHYGFPARHPEYLPNVIDEPSTFDYAPQHQSTCGLNFNEPVQAGWPVIRPGGVGRRRDRHRLLARQTVSHEARSSRPPATSRAPTCSRA